jgi:Uma2 family endonuclease
MATVTLEAPSKTLAEVLHDLGDISLDRIRLPVGTATEQDVIDAMEAVHKRLYELIDGVLVEKDMGMKESIIACKIGQHLANYSDVDDRGVVFVADGPIRIRVGRIRFPDVGFVSWDRMPGGEIPDTPICDVIPDVAGEVISKGNTPNEMDRKLKDYFKAGVRLVWFVYPKTQTAVIYTSVTAKKELGRDDSLDGGKVLPGFSLPLKALFTRSRKRLNGKRSS